ncbi:hypothetical protein DFJ58DRAFT_727910 [Suillus subalutaceus]|uniref:uncharacterized protein n=1 Tax=Suillus subalutaceus TaxID=48586 RepID=UPI001B87D276|nr:uncharacterized protein DFJ58DRAFT_727910 [Suillus subalutaceus]KAG1854477.1 hypothetical protein DFJ58DRAFT_727910 [Suillus subalutaceus]
MSFRISFSDLFYFTRNARKAPLIPEGFVLETPPERKAAEIQLKPEPPTFPSILPTTSQSPEPSPASSVLEISLAPVISTENNSTETLVNVVSKAGFPPPILQLYPPANKAGHTRRISFADCVMPSRPAEPLDVVDVGGRQVPSKPSAAAAETPEQAKPFIGDVPNVEKTSKRKSIVRSISLLARRASGTKAHRFSVPAFSSLVDVMNKRP